MSATTWPWLLPARSSAWRRASISACRPTKRVSPRAANACRRVRVELAPTNSNTSTESANPLTATGPSALTWTNPSASRRVSLVVSTEPSQELHGPFQVRKQHRDLLALAFQGTPGGQDFLRQIGGRIGERGLGLYRRGGCGRCVLASPDQHSTLINSTLVDLNDFHLQI